MGKDQCHFLRSDKKRCLHKHRQLSGYCYWHDKNARKDHREAVEKLLTLYKAGESFEGFELEGADLSGLDFSQADFSSANLKKVNFEKTLLLEVNFTGASLQGALFHKARLHRAIFDKAALYQTDFHQCFIKNCQWPEQCPEEQKADKAWKSKEKAVAKKYYEICTQIYENLYQSLERQGQFQEASVFYYRYCLMQRNLAPVFSRKFLGYYLLDKLCGYGEKPFQVVKFSCALILISASLYCLLGLNIQDQTLIVSSDQSVYKNLSVFFHSLYFSVVTFTTLGYGDITPSGSAKLLAALEAFIGSFTLATFVVVFVKKITR